MNQFHYRRYNPKFANSKLYNITHTIYRIKFAIFAIVGIIINIAIIILALIH